MYSFYGYSCNFISYCNEKHFFKKAKYEYSFIKDIKFYNNVDLYQYDNFNFDIMHDSRKSNKVNARRQRRI